MITETIARLWNSLVEASAVVVTPEWGQLIGLLPILLLVGVVGPLLTILVLAWAHYGFYRPRTRTAFAPSQRAARPDAQGNPVYPAGEPYSPAQGIIYAPGTTRSGSGERLVVGCPKCGLVRSAALDTCGNCGLTFSIRPTVRSLRRSGPPAGGAAAA